MTKLYIIRHGQTLWNIQKKMQGWEDSPLTDLGIKQAKSISEKLKNINFDVIYSSPIGRAVKTAQIIKRDRNIPFIKENGIREIKLGNWEGCTIEQLKERESIQFYNFWHAPHLYKSSSGETFYDVKRRIIKTIKDIIMKNKNKTILIVTHRIALKLIMSYFENTKIDNIWESPYIYQTSLNIVQVVDGKGKIIVYDDISHLKEIKNEVI